MITKSRILSGTALAAGLLVAMPAAAQESSSVEASSTEIVVTAQRREEKLRDVPIAISAATAETLAKAGIANAADLGRVVPGLNFAVQGAFANPTIRGIGTSVTQAGADANVAIYVDGVYQPNQTANLFEFNNIERVEVLKGPQGTLFGRNATGGAIRVITSDPDQDARGRVSAGYGRFNEVQLNAFVNVPLSPTASFNVAALYHRDDGFVRNVTTGNKIARQDSKGFRAKLKLEASDRLSFIIGGSYSDTFNNQPFSNNPVDGNNVARQSGVVFPTGFYQSSVTFDPTIRTKHTTVSLTGKLELDSGTITSISAYQWIKPFLFADIDGSSRFTSHASLAYDEKNFTQELNFASSFDGPFNFVAGAFYYHDDTPLLLTSMSPTSTIRIGTRSRREAISGYAEFTYDIAERLHLTGGIRYSTEDLHAVSTLNGNKLLDKTKRDNAWTPRAVIRYELDDYSNIYGSYSRGFKSGAYNMTSFSPVPVDPEYVDAFEIGYKRAEGGFSINTSAFYYKYKDIQVQIQQNLNGVVSVKLLNAADAEIYGFDLEGSVPVTDAFRLSGGVAYTHARYQSFPGAIITVPIVNAQGVPIGGNTQIAGDASGKDMIRAPDWAANLTAAYKTEVMGGELDMSMTGSYSSGFYWDPANTIKEAPYFLLSAKASWLSPEKTYKLSVWGQNLTDKKYRIYVNNTTTGNSGSPGRPLTFGGSIEVFF